MLTKIFSPILPLNLKHQLKKKTINIHCLNSPGLTDRPFITTSTNASQGGLPSMALRSPTNELPSFTAPG